MRFLYTHVHLEFLRTGFLSMQVPELTGAFNHKFGLAKNEVQIKSALKNHNIKCGRKRGVPKGTFSSFTREQAEFVSNNYTKLCLTELTDELNNQFDTHKTVQ